jgi:hypothetical protein
MVAKVVAPIFQVVDLEFVGSRGNLDPLLMKIVTPVELLYGPVLVQVVPVEPVDDTVVALV